MSADDTSGEGMPQALQTDQKGVVDKRASALGRLRRRKGGDGEREAVKLLKAAGFDAKRSIGQARKTGEAPDIQVDAPLWIEVKRHKRPNIYEAVQQAIDECGDRPLWVVAMTRADEGRWLVTMPAEDFLDLMKEWSASR